MPRMIPSVYRAGANRSERRLYSALEGIMDRPDWIVFHSLPVRQHVSKMMGEADFVVVIPGRGIVVVETKSPKQVDYTEGVWVLDRTPKPHKNPFAQVDGAVGSIRAYLRREGAIEGNEPIARLVWFTSIGRHHFGVRAPSDLTFFEWELAWADDLRQPARTIEKALNEYISWYGRHGRVASASLTEEKCEAITASLLRDFSVESDLRDALREAQLLETEVLAEQRFALELVESNRAVYFDGPAGTGKSYLLAHAAFRAVKRGERTLLTCWNVEMAERLRAEVDVRGPLQVADLGTVMLRVAGLKEHPADATNAWYQDKLPRLALEKLAAESHADNSTTTAPPRPRPGLPGARVTRLGGYRNVMVDEFQDIAGNQLLLDVLLALAARDRRVLFAGDERQQIMRRICEHVDPFAVAKARIPDLVHARIRRNCRQSPQLIHRIEAIVGRQFGFTATRLSTNTPGGAERVLVCDDDVTQLTRALKRLTSEFSPGGVVVLSPWGTRSLASRIIAGGSDGSLNGSIEGSSRPDDVRWLRANLGTGEGRVRFGSISKLKGIEADAVVVTDVGVEAREWAAECELNWDDLLYVALTRAKYRAVVLEQG
ncbi:MAG: NERD domain-containing protein [Ancrocorticia sp.]